MEHTDDWNRFIEALDVWTAAAQIAPGRVQVLLPDGGDAIIVITPDEWDEMAGVMWSDFDDAVRDVKRRLLELRPHERFAVYCQYRLEPSDEATLPEVLLPTPEPGGKWSVVKSGRQGRSVDAPVHDSDR